VSYVEYSVEQYSENISEPIRFAWEGIRNWDKGYQKLDRFTIVYDKNKGFLYIFANNESTDRLLSRIQQNIATKVQLKEIGFDLKRITEIKEMVNLWGTWEKVELGPITTEAKMGSQIHKSKLVDLDKSTAVNIKMYIDEKALFDITLSRNGRISSKTRMTNEDIVSLFTRFFAPLIVA
jgi:predicted PilT family ATPase